MRSILHTCAGCLLLMLLVASPSQAADRTAAEKLVAEASDPSMANDRDKAIELCTRAIELDPTYAKAYVKRAWARRNQGNPKDAADDMAKAIELDPNNDLNWSRLVWYLEESQQFDQAVEAARNGLKANPNSGRLYLELATACGAKGDADEGTKAALMGVALSDTETVVSVRNDLSLRSRESLKNIDGVQKFLDLLIPSKKKIDEGNAALEQHDTETAMKCFNEAIEACKENISAYVARGRGYMSQVEPEWAKRTKRDDPNEDRAIADYDIAIKECPNYAAAYLERGSAFFSKHQTWDWYGTGNVLHPYKDEYFEKALADWAAAIERDPTMVEAYVRRAAAEADQHKSEDAVRDLDKALEMAPFNQKALDLRWPYYKHEKQWEKQIEILSRLVKVSPAPEKYLDVRGQAYIENLDYDAAVADFDAFLAADVATVEPEAKERTKRTSRAFVSRGRASMERGDHDKALKDFNEALELDPKFVGALIARGELYHTMGKGDEALKDFNGAAWGKGIGMEDERAAYARADALRAQVYYSQGDLNKARQAIDESVHSDPTYVRGVALQGAICAQQKYHNAAVQAYTQLIALRPKMAEPLVLRAEQYWADNKSDSAITDLKSATELEAENPHPWAMLGEIQLKTGHPADAADAFERVIKLVPDHSASHLILAVIYASEDDKEAAAREQLEAGLANAQPQEIKEIVAATQSIQKEHADAALLKEIVHTLQQKAATTDKQQPAAE